VNLGKYASRAQINLIKSALGDENSKVRQSAVRILGDLKDPALVKLLKKTFESDNSYVVQAEALRSIGKCGGRKQAAYLESAKTKASFRNVVAKAAAETLATFK
jgi:HEAT repeat protein